MIERELSLWFLRVVEEAAIASAKTMGMGDRAVSDQVAVEAMRRVMDAVPMNGTKKILFAATGVTDGNLLRGVRFFGDGTRTHSLVMTQEAGKVRFVDSIHVERRGDITLRL